jgi:hypothetical protein
MIELTHRNYFKIGYNGTWFNLRTKEDDVFCAEYGRCEREPADFRQECINAARLIGTRHPRPTVMFSGGIDSEVVVRSFHAAHVPFDVAILRFKNDLNIHDISWAVVTCETLGVPYRLFDLDLEAFVLGGDADHYAHMTRVPTLEIATVMWLTDQLDFAVGGMGDPYFTKGTGTPGEVKPDDLWALNEWEWLSGRYRYFLVAGKQGVPGFFNYTPELVYSFVTEHDNLLVVTDQMPTLVNSRAVKHGIFARHFDLMPRPKYTGYERSDHLWAQRRAEFEKLYGHARNKVFIPFDDLMLMLQP